MSRVSELVERGVASGALSRRASGYALRIIRSGRVGHFIDNSPRGVGDAPAYSGVVPTAADRLAFAAGLVAGPASAAGAPAGAATSQVSQADRLAFAAQLAAKDQASPPATWSAQSWSAQAQRPKPASPAAPSGSVLDLVTQKNVAVAFGATMLVGLGWLVVRPRRSRVAPAAPAAPVSASAPAPRMANRGRAG